jgi:nitrogen regulatory protein PII
MELLKRVWVVVKPFKAQDVVEALAGFASVEELCLSECRGYGRQKGHLELYEGSEYRITFMPKVHLEFTCSAFQLEEILAAIQEAARTGRIGDGKILVLPTQRPALGTQLA